MVDKASVPVGGAFIVLLPAGGPFMCLPPVDNASVTVDGPFIFCSTMLDVTADVVGCWASQKRHTADVSLQVLSAVVLCHRRFTAVDRGGRASCSFFFQCVRPVHLCTTTRNSTV